MGIPRKRAASSTLVPRSTSISIPLMVSFGIGPLVFVLLGGRCRSATRLLVDALDVVDELDVGFHVGAPGFDALAGVFLPFLHHLEAMAETAGKLVALQPQQRLQRATFQRSVGFPDGGFERLIGGFQASVRRAFSGTVQPNQGFEE